MKKIFLATLTLLYSGTVAVFATQPTFELNLSFQGLYEEANAAIENQSGNFVVAGSSYYSGQYEAVVAEISPSGAVLNSKRIGTPSGELVHAMFQAADGNYILVGAVYDNPNDYDWFVLKLNVALQPLWYRRYGVSGGNDYANSCAEISPGHYLVTGTVAHGGSAKPSAVVFDSSGTVLREGYLTTNQFASPNYVGRYLGNGTIGFCNLANGLSILDTNGAVLRQLPLNFATFTRDMAAAINNGYAITGVVGYGGPAGSKAGFAIADSALTTLSSMTSYSKSGADVTPAAMIRSASGNYFIAGTEASLSAGNEQPFVLQVDPSGSIVSGTNLMPAGATSCGLNSLTQVSSHGLLVAGRVSSGGVQSVFVALLDSTGTSCSGAGYSLTSTAVTSLSNTLHMPYTGSLQPMTAGSLSSAAGAPLPVVFCNLTSVQTVDHPVIPVALYPSVFTEALYVDASAALPGHYALTLMDMQGRLILAKSFERSTVIEGARLATGIYVVKIADEETGEVICSGKVVHRAN